MDDRRRPAAAAPPRPSVLYSDDPNLGFPGGMLLTGEFSEITDDAHSLRLMALRWRGFRAELRPREEEAVGTKVERLRDLLTEAYRLTNDIDSDLEDLREARREERDARRKR
jgi:hypothetical protein